MPRLDAGSGGMSGPNDTEEDSNSDPVDHSSDGGVWSDTDAREEEQFRGVQSGTIDNESTAAPGNGNVTTHQRELLAGEERSGGATAASSKDSDRFVDETTAAVNNIPGSTNYDVTATDASEGGFGATPGTPGVSATNDPETDGADPTGIDSINTDDPAQATQATADVVDDAANTAREVVEENAPDPRDWSLPDIPEPPEPEVNIDLSAIPALALAAFVVGVGLIMGGRQLA